jgi:hypothetical protein
MSSGCRRRKEALVIGAHTVVAATASSELFGHVVSSRAFAVGLIYGAFAFLGTGVYAALRRSAREGGGITFAAAVLLGARGLYGVRVVPNGLIASILLLAIGGAIAQRMQPRAWAPWYTGFLRSTAALAPGAFFLAATFPLATPSWLRFAAALGALVAGTAAIDFDAEQGPRGAPFALLAASAAAVYYIVPDTELPLVMVGCALPLVFISLPQPLRRLGPAGTAAAMGVYSWVVVVGARGRPGAAVAGIAALGLFLVEPLARRVPPPPEPFRRRHRRGDKKPADSWLFVIGVALIAQFGLGVFCAKIAGREMSPMTAMVMCVPALVLLGAAAPALLPLKRRRPKRPPHVRRRRKEAWMH